MKSDDNRSFKGVWVPRWLYLNRDLSWVEKLILLEVHSLSMNRSDGCFASNEYLAGFLGVSVGAVANAIRTLKSNGHLAVVGEGGGRRMGVAGDAGLALDDKLDMNYEATDTTTSNDAESVLDEEIEIAANGEVVGDGETEVKAGKECVEPIRISNGKRQQVEIVFEFWNSYRVNAVWKGHNKLSFDIINAVTEALTHYSVEEVCGAIANYAKVLLDDKYYWNHTWPLSVFLTVKHGVSKDSPKKWYQFLEDNFVEANYLKTRIEQKEDLHPELTARIIKLYGRMTGNPGFVPDQLRMGKFIEAAEKMTAFFEKRKIQKESWMKLFSQCLDEVYTNKGQIIYPGNLCSNTMWDTIMPQFMLETGA